jgi:cytochrome c553
VKWVLDIVCRWPRLAIPALATVAGVLVFAGITAGLVPIAASAGHWPITEWLLHYAMRRAVATQSLTAPAAPSELDSDEFVLRGAGHFEVGCRPCHGAPGDRLPVVAHAMTPHPPELAPRVPTWRTRELFYIVKHGVKFTGMPAWPATQRNDEVWAVVAFLRQLPGMQAGDYERLVRSDGVLLTDLMGGVDEPLSPPDVVVEICARCHGIDGNGRGVGAFPKLAGQRLEYMRRAFHAYADGRRHSGIMQPIVANLPEESRHHALQFYASLKPMRSHQAVDGELAAQGAAIALNGVEEQSIPACVTCHSRADANAAYPLLAGQYPNYIEQQLRLLQERRRGGSEFVHIMHTFVDRLSEQQMAAVAAYFASHTVGPR